MSWLESAATLLGEDDPGPTPFLVDRLVVHPSMLAMVGAPKVGKTWALIELAISIATGQPAFGSLNTRQGPVILVLEESGRAALHRRLRALALGRGIDERDLSDLHFAANQRVRLTDRDASDGDDSWPQRIRRAVSEIQPAAVFFDPLARVKGSIDENDQREMTGALEFMREIRDLGQCTVGFVHHEGHQARGRMRGSSDLEAFWESKILIKREGERCELVAEHREAEACAPITYALDFDQDRRSMRLQRDVEADAAADELDRMIVGVLADRPEGMTVREIRDAVPRRAEATSLRVSALEDAGTLVGHASQRSDRRGRQRTVTLYFLAADAGSQRVPDSGTHGNRDASGPMRVPVSGALRPGPGTADAVEVGNR